MATVRAPRIVVTLAVAATQGDVAIAQRKNALYVDCVVRHGAAAIPLDATAPASARAGAFAQMDGLLIAGGADLEPSRYGEAVAGSNGVEPERDELEAAAYAAADARGLPILGICRGLQAMNVFAGGKLVQHVDGHAGPGYGHGPAATHGLRMDPASRMARLLNPSAPASPLTVNSYHHQAVTPALLAPAYVATGWSESPIGDIVEAFEGAAGGPWRMAVQCHPERTESTPREFERLFAAFVEACTVR